MTLLSTKIDGICTFHKNATTNNDSVVFDSGWQSFLHFPDSIYWKSCSKSIFMKRYIHYKMLFSFTYNNLGWKWFLSEWENNKQKLPAEKNCWLKQNFSGIYLLMLISGDMDIQYIHLIYVLLIIVMMHGHTIPTNRYRYTIAQSLGLIATQKINLCGLFQAWPKGDVKAH